MATSRQPRGIRPLGAFLSSGLAISAAMGGVVFLTLASAERAYAQEISGTITGRVIDDSGNAVAGATVLITHEPSGTISQATTNADGRFTASGLRLGGPFSVEVSGTGFESSKTENVVTTLGAPVTLLAELRAETLEEVVVASAREAELALGVSSQFSKRDIAAAASISRDIKDVVRLDPKVKIDATNSDAIEIAGTSPRFNSITVDGIRQSDDFGLNNNGYPTQRAPISLDAIEAVSVQTAPFDVQYGNFQGGTINVVTKSGGNDFTGSVFYYKFDDSLVGDKSKTRTLNFTFDEETYGATLGGPIFQDKLFFFLSYEKLERTAPVETGPLGSGLPVEVSAVTQAEYDQVVSLAQSVYNFDVGQLSSSLPENDEKILAKLDWNIVDGHRASLSFQRSEGNEIIQTNSSASQRRISTPSNWYNRGFTLDQVSLQVFSDWSERFSTEFKVGRKKVDAFQDSLQGTDFAEMQIATPSGGTIYLGPDQFRQANAGENDLDQVKIKGQWLLGNHTLVAGYELEKLDIFNLFVPNSEGQYFFDCITPTATCTNAFSTRTARELRYSNAVTNNKFDGAASFSFDVQTFYLQDTWQVTPRLTLQGGLRFETYSSGDRPPVNANFVARNGFANTETFDGRDLILPRLGFNFLLDDDTTLYGGLGQFGGGTPNVWLSNSFSNDGVTIVNTTVNAMSPALLQTAALQNVDGFTIPAEVQALLLPGNGTVNAIDPNFEIPSSWRYSLGVDRRLDLGFLGDGYRAKAEVIYTDVKDGVFWQDLRLRQSGTAPDGRPLYTSAAPGGNDLLITNTDQGDSLLLSFDISKTWRTAAGQFDLYVGYAYNEAEDVNPGTSSVAFSSFGRVGTSDPNNPVVATSNYETRHRFPISLNWRKAFWGDYETGASLFVERRSGRPYSLTFGRGTSVFGDPSQGGEQRQLLFLPANLTDVDYAGGLTAAAMQTFIDTYGLAKYQGGIVPRNAFSSPWVTTADLRLSQEIPTFIKGTKGVVTLDIENFANLVNSDWGRLEQVSFPHFSPTVDASIVNGRYVYRPVAGATGVNVPFRSLTALQSVWRIQLGVRFEF